MPNTIGLLDITYMKWNDFAPAHLIAARSTLFWINRITSTDKNNE